MICIIALIVFSILSIFSAAYRPVAREAFDCVFRRITLRKCESGLDTRLKSKITGKLIVKSPKAARIVHRYFEVFSWFFVLLFFASLAYSGYSVYNIIAYGNCNGDNPSAFCPLVDPFRSSESTEPAQCSVTGETVNDEIRILSISPDDPRTGPEDAPVTIIEAGCFRCHYTKKAVPWVKELLSEYQGKIQLIYKDFPLGAIHDEAEIAAEAAHCANDQDRFWEYHDMIFANQEKISIDNLKVFAIDLGLDTEKFNECLDSRKYRDKIETEFKEAKDAGIYGTPTFFINDQVIIGPKSYDELKEAVEKEL